MDLISVLLVIGVGLMLAGFIPRSGQAKPSAWERSR